MNTSTRFGGLVSESDVRSSVVEAKIRSNSLFYIMRCYCVRGVGNKNSYPFPYNSESLFVGVGDK